MLLWFQSLQLASVSHRSQNRSLCATFGHEARFVLEQFAISVLFLGKYEFVCYWDHVAWPFYEFPCAHAFELFKLRMNGLLPFGPFWRFSGLMEAVALIWDGLRCLFSHGVCNPIFLFIWERIVQISIVNTDSSGPTVRLRIEMMRNWKFLEVSMALVAAL
jgi:hypothetical protein